MPTTHPDLKLMLFVAIRSGDVLELLVHFFISNICNTFVMDISFLH